MRRHFGFPRFFVRAVVLIPIVVIAAGCATCGCSRPAEGPSLLFMGNQAKIDSFASRISQGKVKIQASWLRDLRKLRPDVILRIKIDYGEGVAQLGVETVSDFFSCLLQFRAGVTTEEVITKNDPDLAGVCKPDVCDVCTSWTYPLDPRVRAAVIRYWLNHLDSGHTRVPRRNENSR